MLRTALAIAVTGAVLASSASPALATGSPVVVRPVVATDAARGPAPASATVHVGGAVADPASYSPAAVAAQPQVTVVGADGRSVSGASLQALTLLSGPTFDSGKNPQLREAITVTGLIGEVRFAAGELDAGFGNHPALLVIRDHRVDLVVPGDRLPLRTVLGIVSITVEVVATSVVTPPSPGSVTVTSGGRTVLLPASLLALLPQETRTVTYLAGTTPSTLTERGPSLLLVLLVAGILPTPGTLVTAVATDGYAASVTAGEALLGGRPLLLSLVENGVALAQPRLVADGDLKGGRYVSGVTSLVVSPSSPR